MKDVLDSFMQAGKLQNEDFKPHDSFNTLIIQQKVVYPLQVPFGISLVLF